MSVQKRRRKAILRRQWVIELREQWAETHAILADPLAMSAIADADAEATR
jgi:hypothetical protein